MSLKLSKQPSPSSQQKLNELANLALLQQELAGMEAEACVFLQGFHQPGSKLTISWLLPGEGLDSLQPEQVSTILQHLDRFKARVKDEMGLPT